MRRSKAFGTLDLTALSGARGATRPTGIIARIAGLVALVSVLQPKWVLACAACYGQSDAPMARGMNWGIFSLLVVIGLVLATVASFFVYLAKRAAAMNSADSATAMTVLTDNV